MSVIREKIKWVLHSDSGALAPAFAIILPCLLAMMSFGLDSVNLLSTKTRLANAMDEAALAVSATGKSDLNKDELKAAQLMATNYVRYHLPGIASVPVISVSGINEEMDANGFKFTRYELSATLKVPIIFNTGTLAGFDHDIDTGSGNRLVKKFTSVATDYVFVLDFSGSMQGTRLNDLKAVVKEISQFALENNEKTQIALVPFSIGVPVKLPGKNERGGERVGCSVLFVPKANYNINYAFWADKQIQNPDYYTLNSIIYNIDLYRYRYYIEYVKPAMPAMSEPAVLRKWCVRNSIYGSSAGKYLYSCKTEGYPDSDIYSEHSKLIISKEYQSAWLVKKYHDNYGTIFNDYVTDYQATLQEMFSDEAVITFPLEWTAMVKDKDHTYIRPYSSMCLNGGWFKHISNNDLSRSSARSWLVELTSDISVLDQFQNMQAYGNTQISSGLIRSVPVMMKGSNKRKVFILISDGEDNSGKNVTQNFLKQYHLCEKIKKGVAEKSGISNTRVEMYYISVTSDATRVKEWADNCVGEANAKTSTTREALIKEIKGIMADETGHFAS